MFISAFRGPIFLTVCPAFGNAFYISIFFPIYVSESIGQAFGHGAFTDAIVERDSAGEREGLRQWIHGIGAYSHPRQAGALKSGERDLARVTRFRSH